jgi:aspartate/methionine/tyrosine aminotransferase
MLETSLAPYLYWAKTRETPPIDLAGSNLLHCTIDELPGAREALDLSTPSGDGYQPLVQAIADHYGTTPDWITTAPGCSGANLVAIATLVGAGDEVLVEQPTYDPLLGVCRLMGASIKRFTRRFDAGYAVEPGEVRQHISARTRLVIMSRPHNPTGAVVPDATLVEVGRLAASVGAWVLVDEVYLDAANLTAEDRAHHTPAARLDGPLISTSSLTKSFGLAGLRCGWAVAPTTITERLRRTRDLVDVVSSAPSDRLSALAFSMRDRLGARTKGLLGQNTAIMRAFLAVHPQLEVALPPHTSITFPRLTAAADAGPFVERLLREEGVAVAPGRFFDAPSHFRVSLAGQTDVLRDGLARLGRVLDSLTR